MTKIAIAGGNDNFHLELAQTKPEEETNFAEAMNQYGVILMMQETSEQELIDLSSDLPTDTHLVTYETPNFTIGVDAVRAYKMSDIFDCYKDAGLKVRAITSGFGSIKPKLFIDSKKQ